MTHNGTYLWISTAQGKLYTANSESIIDLSSEIGDLVIDVTSQDGYNIAAQRNSNRWHLSGLDAAGNTVSGLNTTADSLPGNIVGIISDHREVLVFKETSIETYQNVGAPDFPFRRTQLIERGCAATNSIAKYKNSVFWLGEDLQVYTMSGYQPQPIATPSIASIIEGRESQQTAIGFTYQQAGQAFYVLSFSDLTIAYGIDSGLWHQKESQNYNGRWKCGVQVYIPSWRKHIGGDIVLGKLYEVDVNTYDDAGEDIVRQAHSSPVWNNANRFIIDEFVLDAETGVGIQNIRETAWAQDTAYSVGDLVSSNGNVYRCSVAGTSISVGNGPLGRGAGLVEEVSLTNVLALLESIRISMAAHVTIESGEFPGHSVSDVTSESALIALANSNNNFTEGVSLASSIISILADHRTDVNHASHPTDDTVNVTAAKNPATNHDELITLADELRIDYMAHSIAAAFHSGGSPPSGNVTDILLGPVRWDFVQTEVWGEDPEVILDWSDDGGKVWSNQLRRSLGKIGERLKQVRWHRLGMHRNLVFRIRISDPVPVRLHGAYIRMDPMRS
jgi:hypothetical protein